MTHKFKILKLLQTKHDLSNSTIAIAQQQNANHNFLTNISNKRLHFDFG